ncbi:EAL domain-containing protein [Rhodovulum adriaticum]|uniref:EAL domain-containing protein (Putative c-di-GMP-specific phosphodiesterase class I) n=1 Tax=Rhodovulum adriaticum TaxID=35804 RepID=A0A4R2NLA3_RHOAD|nr:EAL domain-containing protein [Rhodovulum adriaticum]MBK1635474.1 diguanylate phosphodiesterase [Rhodovulum adriaticum]TCP22045.1 EAL domain-containing protein (putative c-di-GMP-specific phosphodiesterase class I) [Rhodovulum adriaticum]
MPKDRKDPEVISDPAEDSPLSAAITQRDRDTLNMVARALREREVALAFQPVVQAVPQGQVAFYEGLIRVLDPSGRVIPARDFIPTVETTEMGRQLDCLALEMGLIALAEAPDLRLSINMSARSIGYPRWTATLNAGLANNPRLAERLILEITESSAIVMPDLVSVFMRDLQARGIAFALDDFGAGYTAFRYLREFYFDLIKIDGQFIRGIAETPDNQVLTAALISIARHFDMFTVAENVENASDAAWLSAAGIDCMQGYAFGAPSLVPPWREGDDKRLA